MKKRYCRLCRAQPALHGNRQITELEPFLRAIGHQQLFLAGLQRPRPRRTGAAQPRRQGRAPRPEPVTPTSNAGWTQGRLFDAPRDYSRFNRRRHAVLTNPILARSRQAAATIGEARGWTRRVCNDVDRALVILLSRFVDGDKVRFSELFPALRRYRLTVERTVEVLDHLDLFDDDRTPTFDYWLERKLADLDAGIRADVEPWLRTLHDGGPRSRPRSPDTVWGYLNDIHPVLLDWSHRYHRLREVTHADVVAVSDALHGNKRHHTISVLRSLFRHCKKNNTIFRDPATGVRVGQQPQGVILPLRPTEIADALAAATTPAARLAIALAGVHAARPKAIRELLLDDVDLGNRRLIVTGRTRPLRRPHPPRRPRLARPPANPLAEHRQPAPDHQPADSHGDRTDQQRLDHAGTSRPDRHPGSAARRPPTRRSPHPRTRPAPPRSRLRPRRQDRHSLRRRRPAPAGLGRRALRRHRFTTNPRIETPTRA